MTCTACGCHALYHAASDCCALCLTCQARCLLCTQHSTEIFCLGPFRSGMVRLQAPHVVSSHTCCLSWHAQHMVSCAGMIATKCCPSQVVGDAVMDARSICMREYASAPEVNIYGDPNFTFPYVPSHLHHMTFELVKNSLRAVNDKYDDSDDEPPPIRLVVAEGEEDITIKVHTAVSSQASVCHSRCEHPVYND